MDLELNYHHLRHHHHPHRNISMVPYFQKADGAEQYISKIKEKDKIN